MGPNRTDPWNVRTELVAIINYIRLTVISHNIAAVALMWKAAGGVKAGSSPLEAALPHGPPRGRALIPAGSFPQEPGLNGHYRKNTAASPHVTRPEGETHTHTHIWVSTSGRLSGLLMVIVARIVPASPFSPSLFPKPSLWLSYP